MTETPPTETPPTETPPTDQQTQEYLQQLRSAPAEQLVSELLSGLLNAAQVKLGRRDARLLIDLSAVVVDHSRAYLPAELTRQVDQILGQLRLGQVQAEGAAGGEPEPNDLAETPRPPAGGTAESGQPAAESAARPTAATSPPPPPPRPAGPPPASQLWIPGRDF